MSGVRRRRLGRTGLDVSELTVGTAGLDAAAWKDLDPAETGAAIALAVERGVNAVEVEAGEAEEPLGQILRSAGVQDRVHVFSRVASLVPLELPSPHVPAPEVYPGAHIRASTEASLKRLGVERLGLQQLHVWCTEWLHEGDWLETLQALRQEGKIAGFGVSLFDHDVAAGLETVASGAVDTVQVMYNVFDQGAAQALFPLCERKGVGVIARSPLYYGALSSGFSGAFPPGDWRGEYFYDEHLTETRERADRLAPLLPSGEGLAETALRFALSHAAVSTVAVGMRTRAHVEANLQAMERGPLDAEILRALAEHRWLCSG